MNLVHPTITHENWLEDTRPWSERLQLARVLGGFQEGDVLASRRLESEERDRMRHSSLVAPGFILTVLLFCLSVERNDVPMALAVGIELRLVSVRTFSEGL